MRLRVGRGKVAVLLAGLLVTLGVAATAPTSASAAPKSAAPKTAAPKSAPTSGGPAYRHGAVPTLSHTSTNPARAQTAASQVDLSFHGGVNNVGVTTGPPRVYLVFWGAQWGSSAASAQGYQTLTGDTQGMAPDLQAFMKGLGTSGETWSGIMTQYCEGVAAGAQSCPATAPHVGYPTGGALAGVWADTGAAGPAAATAHDLAAEAVAAATHFGNTTAAANRNAQYFIVSPPGSNPDGFNTVQGNFCAWHDWSGDAGMAGGGAVSSPFPVAFVNMPYIPDAGSNCGMNFVNRGPSGALDGVTLAGGHEYAEVLTDQFPGGGWFDGYGLEAGDLCAWIPPGSGQGASADLTLTTGPFAVQSIWANDFRGGVPGRGGCIMSHSTEVDGTPNSAPVITTWSTATFSAGVPGTFSIAVTGFPVPTISATGLPGGVHLTDNHDGTATIAGISSASAGGQFAATISAANAIGGPVTQAFTLVVMPWSGTIVNFAGMVGTTGNSGDGGPATAATLYAPSGEAFDRSGNLYIADFNNNRVRKVDPAGNITNFAGSADGSSGASGDGGPATAATLYGPAAVALDAAGNVYIADRYNSRIRKVDTAGTISTVAGSTNGLGGNTGDGGPAIAARLNNPTALAMDGAGNLYIDDIGNNRVRRIDSAGMITNFAGDPSGAPGNTGDGGPAVAATLSSPVSVAVDAAGTVYIADLDNNRIRRVDPSGIITNFAGDPGGAVGDSGDFGAATAALLYRPNSVAVDRAGNVFIAEAADNRIKKVDTAGIIQPFAGGVNQLPDGGDEGPAILAQVGSPVALVTDAAGDLFYADSNQRIRHIMLGPAITSRAATFTETIAETFALPVASLPPATVTEAGILPRGISFNPATNTLSGTPAAGSTGTYPITFHATNGVGHDVTQAFTLTVNRAVMLSPRAGQAGFDTTQPFTWSGLAQAQAYLLTVGTAQYGTDVTNSGILPGSQTSYQGPSLPVGPTLYATVYAELNNTWIHYPSISFTAAPGQGAFTYPVDSDSRCDPTHPITWATIPQAQGYEVSVSDGRSPGNIVNSGPLPPSQSSYTPKAWLPQDTVMTATLSTEVNGSFSRSQWITIDCGPPRAAFIYPKNLQLNVSTPATFGWSPIWAAQHYIFVLGTTLNGTDVLVSGLLPPSQTTINVPALAHGKVYFASILTEVKGAWLYQAIGITAK